MAILKIRLYNDPVLRKETVALKNISSAVIKLAHDMIETMHDADGIGLAAPQIGKSIRLFVVDISPFQDGFEPMVFINPEIIDREGSGEFDEGCLSIPDVSGTVVRPQKITIKYMDLSGVEVHGVADGILARVVQHEYDHLHGRLFIDYLDEPQLEAIRPALKKLESRYKRSAKKHTIKS